jgi:hypothetical protein
MCIDRRGMAIFTGQGLRAFGVDTWGLREVRNERMEM